MLLNTHRAHLGMLTRHEQSFEYHYDSLYAEHQGLHWRMNLIVPCALRYRKGAVTFRKYQGHLAMGHAGQVVHRPANCQARFRVEVTGSGTASHLAIGDAAQVVQAGHLAKLGLG